VEDLDALVRRVDEDRWMASRFAPADVRVRLLAIYALNHEIARTAEIVKEPALGDVRLAWWRDAIADALAGGASQPHDALQALARAHAHTPLSPTHFTILVEARRCDWDTAPFADWAAFDAYVDATAGGVMRLAAEACGARDERADFLSKAAWIWGATGLLRAEPVWRARGRDLWPNGGTSHDVITRVGRAIQDLRAIAPPSAPIFPAYGYVANAAAYLRAIARAGAAPGLFRRQVRLVAASVTGRV
jgi:phytoene synthase